MRNYLLAMTAVMAAALTGTASAAPAAAPMSMTAAATKSGHGVGVVRSIDAKAGTVTIQHGPIAAIGWPAMIMAFKARRPAMLRDIKPGEKVGFDMTTNGASAEVTMIGKQ